MMKTTLLFSLPLSIFTLAVHAQPLAFEPPIKAKAIITERSSLLTHGQVATKDVALMKLALTPAQRQLLTSSQASSHALALTTASGALPAKASIDMRTTPVLDQGQHGTCVTFATSAALDSLLNQGDYVSELCSLMLGQYLESRSYEPSGWNGSYGPLILNQLLKFGVVAKREQQTQGCAGLYHYPLDDRSDEISKHSFKDITEYKKNE